MKTTRLIAYGVAGMIAGLLLENSGLRARNKGRKATQNLKKKIADSVKKT